MAGRGNPGESKPALVTTLRFTCSYRRAAAEHIRTPSSCWPLCGSLVIKSLMIRRTLCQYLPIAFCLFLACCFITDFSYRLFTTAAVVTDAFDALAASLRRFDVAVTLRGGWQDLDWINGKPVMYFGMWPAVLRIPANGLFPQYYGLWAPLSCLAAYAVALFAVAKNSALALKFNSSLSDGARDAVTAAVILGAGLGTPLFYLASWANIWHESMLWGAAFSLWGIFGILAYIERRNLAALFILSCSAALTLHARPTFAAPLFLSLAAAAADYILFSARARGLWSRVSGLLTLSLIPAFTGLLVQAWYNYMRFGTVFSIVARLSSKGDGAFPIFAVDRIPIAARLYFAPLEGYISPHFPLFHPLFWRDFKQLVIDSYPQHEIWIAQNCACDPIFPFTFSALWLLLALPIGLKYISKRESGRVLGLLAALFFLAQCLLMLAYYYITLRFEAEFLPLAFFGLWLMLQRVQITGFSARLLLWLFSIILCISVTLLATLSLKLNPHADTYLNQGGHDSITRPLLAVPRPKSNHACFEGAGRIS